MLCALRCVLGYGLVGGDHYALRCVHDYDVGDVSALCTMMCAKLHCESCGYIEHYDVYMIAMYQLNAVFTTSVHG